VSAFGGLHCLPSVDLVTRLASMAAWVDFHGMEKWEPGWPRTVEQDPGATREDVKMAGIPTDGPLEEGMEDHQGGRGLGRRDGE
jgi:hypothetical protein